MKLGTSLFFGASSLACLGLAATLSVQGCSSSDNTTTNNTNDGGGSGSGSGGTTDGGGSGSGSGGTDSGSGGYTSAQPPAAPTGPATGITVSHNFALHHIHLGDETATTPAFPAKSIGYDIDGKDSTALSTDVCTQFTGASKKSQADGDNGIDNSFGINIVPVLGAVAANPSATISSSINAGGFTLMLNIAGIDSANLTQTATGLTGQLFGGVKFGVASDGGVLAPTWSVNDNWPIDPATLSGTSQTSPPFTPAVAFSSPYISNGTFVSGAPTEVKISVTISGHPLTLDVKHAIVTFQHDTATNATKGIISGVLVTSDFLTAISKVSGAISTSFCPGAASFSTLSDTINGASDIMQDGTNVAGKTCDAISVGIGFDADEIGLPSVLGTTPGRGR